MLDVLIKSMGHGVSYGSGALKALQNDNMPELDLLVREAIQNSSDAALKVEGDNIQINFNVGSFVPSRFNKELAPLTQLLDMKYATEQATFLEIRDSNTSGLTGPITLEEVVTLAAEGKEDHGNYFKLIFDTGKEQTASSEGEAGGSYGYGKSVYYRVGTGLVVFYSQVKENGLYKERMIFSLVEHEADSSSLLKKVQKDSIGRAWWGVKHPQKSEELLPIQDGETIQSILDIFGLKRFKDNQTGTSIIIPYIDESRLLDGIFPEECGISQEEMDMCSWKDSITDYLELSIQKWYAPKIFNKKLTDYRDPKAEYNDQKWLGIRVNGRAIKDTTMRPFFQLVQELYTVALAKNKGKEYTSEKYPNIECASIPSQRVVGKVSGHAAYVRIKQDELSSTGSMIKPYTYLRLFSKSPLNDPIVMFARTPGMVLDYKIDGKWAKGLTKPEEDDEYIVAFYVPDCSVKLRTEKNLGAFSGEPLGEYLRKCEKSDHMEWEDKSNMTVAGNIKNQVIAKVNHGLKTESQTPVEGTTSKLAGKLGRRLLPTTSFGKRNKGGGGAGGGGGSSSDNLEIMLVPKIEKKGMDITYALTFKNVRKSVVLGVFVETETGVMDAEAWEENIGKPFPITVEEIVNAKVFGINSKKTIAFDFACNDMKRIISNDFSQIELLYTKSGESIRGIKISNVITNAVDTGIIRLRTVDRKYVCTIKEVKES